MTDVVPKNPDDVTAVKLNAQEAERLMAEYWADVDAALAASPGAPMAVILAQIEAAE